MERSTRVQHENPFRFEDIVKAVSDAGADFVVIGGIALSIIGGDYVTFDADFAFTRRRENARAIVSALAPYHPMPVDWPDGVPFVWDEQTVMKAPALTLVTDLGRVDFLAELTGAPPYVQLKARAPTIDLEGRVVRVACIEDQIAMKRAAGRPKDIAHIAELETIQRLMSEEGG